VNGRQEDDGPTLDAALIPYDVLVERFHAACAALVGIAAAYIDIVVADTSREERAVLTRAERHVQGALDAFDQ